MQFRPAYLICHLVVQMVVIGFSLSVRATGEEAARTPAAVFPKAIEERSNDKRQYWLFNPTPKEKMREYGSDNGGITNGPYTLDAGHFQIETELVNFSYFVRKPSADETNLNP